MRVYLDDVRQEPDGWTRAYTAPEAIALLEAGGVTEISLDHDLGDQPGVGDGYDVVRYLEEKVHTDESFILPTIHLHTANPVAWERMNAACRAIRRKGGFE